MKSKITSICVLIIVLSFSAFAGSQAVSEASTPQITATLQSQSPDPVEPGQILTVKFKIENKGKETTNDVIVRLLPKFPFSLESDVAEKNVGKMRSVATGADAEIVEYKIKVDENAVEGNIELELEIQLGNGKISYTNNEFKISVETHDAVLDITSIKSEPSNIAPGQTATIHITVKNLADSLLKDIKFKLDFDNDNLPLAPFQSSSERRIAQLKSDFQDSLSFSMIASPDATPGLYKLPVKITYNDEIGKNYSISDILAVTIGDIPKLRPTIKKSTSMKKGTPTKITIGLANAGTSDVKFVELFLLDSEDYQRISTSDYYYIGDVDSDDTESEEIDIYINKNAKTLHLPVKLKYFDANNKEFQQQFNLEMKLYSSSELKKYGLEKPRNVVGYIIMILLIIGGIIYYKRYYKNPNKSLRKDIKLVLKR